MSKTTQKTPALIVPKVFANGGKVGTVTVSGEDIAAAASDLMEMDAKAWNDATEEKRVEYMGAALAVMERPDEAPKTEPKIAPRVDTRRDAARSKTTPTAPRASTAPSFDRIVEDNPTLSGVEFEYLDPKRAVVTPAGHLTHGTRFDVRFFSTPGGVAKIGELIRTGRAKVV